MALPLGAAPRPVLDTPAGDGPSAPDPTFLDGLPTALEALAYARRMHARQTRTAGSAARFLHPLEVAALLQIEGYPERVVVVALLHDIIEDTESQRDDIAERFGESVAALVAALTENSALEPYEARKADLRTRAMAAGSNAIAVFAADKVVKVRELRAELSHGGVPETEGQRQRRAHYAACLALLEERSPELTFVRQLRFELEALHGLSSSER